MNKRKSEDQVDHDDGTVRSDHVPDWVKSDLLDTACRLLREAAEYCRVSTDTSASHKDHVPSRNHGFNAKLRAELDIIVKAKGAAEGKVFNTQQLDSGDAFLDTLEEDWVDLSADGIRVDESTYDEGGESYVLLLGLFSREVNVTDSRRRTWLLARLKVDQPSWKLQKRLLRDLGKHAAAIAAPIEMAPTTEWNGTKPIFDAMSAAHEALLKHWISVCKCKICDHYDTKISLGRASDVRGADVTCLAVSSISHGHAVYWRSVKLKCSGDGKHGTSTSRKRKVMFDDEPDKEQATPPVKVCELLQVDSSESIVEIASGGLTVKSAKDLDGSENPIGSSPALFSHWSTDRLPETILSSKLRQRLSLALTLAYAYLHLSGSALWPRQQTSNELWQYIDPKNTSEANWQLLFSLTPRAGNTKQKALASFINKSSPSLPILGTMLLALISGEKVSWDTYEDQIKNAKEEPFAKALVGAVDACLDAQELKLEGETDALSDKAREVFLQKVVLPLQSALEVGFGVTFDALFGARESQTTSGKHDADQASDTHRVHRDRCNARHNHCSTTNTTQHPSDQWLATVQHHIQPYFLHRSDAATPVKIAIIDTGLKLSADSHTLHYERIAECRSWISAAATGYETGDGYVFQADEDDDGHGTHIASTVLDITAEAEPQIYVARVVRRRDQAGPMRPETEEAIAKAIEYAVETWGVSIISLSLGTSHVVPAIEKAIEKAQAKKVLIFASASNFGGNQGRSWPAKRRDVFCVHATDALGNPYDRNPSALAGESNFAVLGVDVQSEWLPNADSSTQLVRQTGTSFATPIAAGIAALVISLMQNWQEAYVHWRVEQAQRHGQLGYMMRIFMLMHEPRGLYHYVVPEKLFEAAAPQDLVWTIKRILHELD
ncbi:hypothetical protein B0A48_04605 [Cryoendolithus antarcticus]|uniref:Peptidase S8/S53 domain-containing protein n=1 Tax=Cryoendolithus antarcticus TaxID=1507870 RepID=A0A1V8TFT8_9PEZI|nr:hypothetical protein B0A48_04605 [Cryoendolithus antarcticus]